MKPHGIMFHHFHDECEHIRGQGSISTQQFDEMLQFLQKDKVILSPDDWMNKALNKTLKTNEICLTFDDNLKCQFDVAYPVLKKYNLRAFWFIYTSPLEGILEKLEIYRYFRSAYFEDINDFYNSFFSYINQSEYSIEVSKALDTFSPSSYLSDYSFYTDNDRTFRYLRDIVLKPYRYELLMDAMLDEHHVDLDCLRERLWMTKDNIKELHHGGQRIGLHTHTHPTLTATLDANEQMNEYEMNSEILSEILGIRPNCMSHPCNSYNQDTITVLENLHIKIGFRSNMMESLNSIYEFPREDHANILKEMELPL